jgi:hypothetical protein
MSHQMSYTNINIEYRYAPARLGSVKDYAVSLIASRNIKEFTTVIGTLYEFPLRELKMYLINLRRTREFVYPGSDVSVYNTGITIIESHLEHLDGIDSS